MPVTNKIQNKLNKLQVTKIDTPFQKHDSFKIEQYKEVDILPMQAKAIQMIALGYDMEEASKKTRIKQTELEHLITTEVGISFMEKTLVAISSDCPVEKRDLILELLGRLHTATDRNCVAIISQISKMMDFEQKEHQNIAFVFVDDPWRNQS